MKPAQHHVTLQINTNILYYVCVILVTITHCLNKRNLSIFCFFNIYLQFDRIVQY